MPPVTKLPVPCLILVPIAIGCSPASSESAVSQSDSNSETAAVSITAVSGTGSSDVTSSMTAGSTTSSSSTGSVDVTATTTSSTTATTGGSSEASSQGSTTSGIDTSASSIGTGGRTMGGSGGVSTSASTESNTNGMGGTGGNGIACATNQISVCSGTNPIECHFGGEPGDYQVTVELGSPTPGDMYVEAESHRRVLGPITTEAGQTRSFSFFVNVRQPEGQPIQNVPSGTPGLDLYIRGTAPALTAICAESKQPAPKLWIAGDSTVCDQDGTDYAGWGQHLPQFFGLPVSVANYADSGESSGSFLGSGSLWGAIKQGWTAGDWVMIQLGHNDKDVAGGTFRSNLSSMVSQAKAAGVQPILVTPTSRVGYALEDEHVNSTGADLPQIMRDIATSEDVPLIDLTVTTWNWLQTVDWTEYFALGTDRTHTNPKGAEVIAGFVRDAVRDQNIGLAPYLR